MQYFGSKIRIIKFRTRSSVFLEGKKKFSRPMSTDQALNEMLAVVFDEFLAFIVSISLPPPDTIRFGYRNCHM